MSRGENGERKHKKDAGNDEQRWEWNDKMIKKKEMEGERVKSGKSVEKKNGKTCKKVFGLHFKIKTKQMTEKQDRESNRKSERQMAMVVLLWFSN